MPREELSYPDARPVLSQFEFLFVCLLFPILLGVNLVKAGDMPWPQRVMEVIEKVMRSHL